MRNVGKKDTAAQRDPCQNCEPAATYPASSMVKSMPIGVARCSLPSWLSSIMRVRVDSTAATTAPRVPPR